MLSELSYDKFGDEDTHVAVPPEKRQLQQLHPQNRVLIERLIVA